MTKHIHGQMILIIGGLFALIFLAIAWNNHYYDKQIANLQSQINDLPKRVCHNETVEEEVVRPYTCITDNSKGIHCNNITLKSGEVYQTNCFDDLMLHWICFNNSEVINPQKEIIKSTKEVCNIE